VNATETKISQAIILLQQALALMSQPGDDVLFLARAIQGEGAGLFTDRALCGLWIGHTAVNLYQSDWQAGRWASVADVVRDRFHGYVNVTEPADWAIDLADMVLHEDDITGGAQAMLSLADLHAHGWPLRDDLLLHAFTMAERPNDLWHLQLRFYGTWAEEWK